ncbi:MAG: hypothetical protein QOF81_3395 [Acidimicrobiaceae bacterium]|nr:hypothetical protein [Acidimicrobiaceae bacterium]
MEDQPGALGLVLNCVTLWNTVYLNAALERLRANGYRVLDEDVARLSPYMRRHLNVHGQYSFQPPELVGARRALRDPDTPQTTLTDATRCVTITSSARTPNRCSSTLWRRITEGAQCDGMATGWQSMRSTRSPSGRFSRSGLGSDRIAGTGASCLKASRKAHRRSVRQGCEICNEVPVPHCRPLEQRPASGLVLAGPVAFIGPGVGDTVGWLPAPPLADCCQHLTPRRHTRGPGDRRQLRRRLFDLPRGLQAQG